MSRFTYYVPVHLPPTKDQQQGVTISNFLNIHRIYGYVRGVHLDIQERQQDVDKQVAVFRRYAHNLVCMHSDLIAGKIYSDVGRRLRKTGMQQLPAGQRLLRTIKRGDHLVIAHYARVFSTPHSFLLGMYAWKQRGIIVHLAEKDLDMRMDTPEGELLLRFLRGIHSAALFERRQAASHPSAHRRRYRRRRKTR